MCVALLPQDVTVRAPRPPPSPKHTWLLPCLVAGVPGLDDVGSGSAQKRSTWCVDAGRPQSRGSPSASPSSHTSEHFSRGGRGAPPSKSSSPPPPGRAAADASRPISAAKSCTHGGGGGCCCSRRSSAFSSSVVSSSSSSPSAPSVAESSPLWPEPSVASIRTLCGQKSKMRKIRPPRVTRR